MKEKYFIKNGYRSRTSEVYYNDKNNKDEFQDEVYKHAHEILTSNNFNSVLDVGAGSGYKLLKYFGENNTIGIDLQQTVDFLNDKYPQKKWLSHDISENLDLNVDIVIASDIIEHILEPNILLDFMKNINFKFGIISTPERDRARGKNDIGPPKNYHHIREWNKDEFKNYISSCFRVIDQKFDKNTQYIIFTKK